MHTLKIAILATALTSIASLAARAQLPSDLRRFIQLEANGSDVPGSLRYQATRVDLHNGDDQYIVYWSGSNVCGSGGCNMEILERRGHTFRIITNTTVTRLPIRVLDSQTNGWHDIGVFVAGGGILPGYESRLRFNGRKYPSNPSMQPRSHNPPGKVVLSDSTPAIQLFPEAHRAP